jgi:two-component system OmpR family response regulator
VKKGGEVLRLTPKEFSVLEYLMRNAGRAVSRDELLSHCWDFAYDPESNITDAYIKQLRKKLHDTDETYIKTVRGVGYTLAA